MTTADERLREALAEIYEPMGWADNVADLKRELAARGLEVREIGEPSVIPGSPCSESIGRGDEPTGNEGLQTAHLSSRKGLEAAWIQQGLTIAALEQALRDLLHVIDTAQGKVITDHVEIQADHHGGTITIQLSSVYRQDFSANGGVTRAREILQE